MLCYLQQRWQKDQERIADGLVHHLRQVKGKALQYAQESVYRDWRKAEENVSKAAEVLHQRTKRLALLACLIEHQAYFCTDCLVDLFIREVRRLHNRARSDLAAFQAASINESEQLISILFKVASARSEDIPDSTQLQLIDQALDGDPQTIALRCERLVLHGLTSHLPFLKQRYIGKTRRTLLNCLMLLDIDHTAHGGDLLACLNIALKYRNQNLATLAVNAIDSPRGEGHTAIDWIGTQWSSVLYRDQAPNKINRIMDAKLFEIALLNSGWPPAAFRHRASRVVNRPHDK